MHLKKCAACARAILESAAFCQYCGHGDGVAADQPSERSTGIRTDAFDADFGVEEQLSLLHEERPLRDDGQAVDQGDSADGAHADGAASTEAASVPFADDSRESAEHEPTLFGDGPAAPVHEREFDFLQDAQLPSLQDERQPSFQDEQLPSLVDALAAEPEVTGDTPEESSRAAANAPASPVVSAQPARRKTTTLVIGAAAVGVLVVAMLTMRGAASPGTNTATPAPAPNVKPKPAAAAKPAAVKAQPALPATPVVPAPTWSHVTDGRWVGRDRRGIAFELNAINKVPIWMRQVRPTLVVRCLSRSTEVFVYTQTAARMEPEDENHTVRLRVDGGQEVTGRWADSAEHDALFAPDGPALARELMEGRTLRFGFTPHNANPVVAEFDVSGLAKLLTPYARQCGFKN